MIVINNSIRPSSSNNYIDGQIMKENGKYIEDGKGLQSRGDQ